MNRYLSECLGAFFLVLTVGLATSYGDKFAPLAAGTMLVALTYLGFHTSGAHYNPAITLAQWIRKKLSPKDLGLYVLAQLVGAFAASGLVMLVALDDSFHFELRPGRGDFPFQAALVELVFSFLLVLVYLVTTHAGFSRGKGFYGLAIGFTLMAAMFVGGPISGGAFNPVTGVAPNVIQLSFRFIWIYAAAPLVGGALAAYAVKAFVRE